MELLIIKFPNPYHYTKFLNLVNVKKEHQDPEKLQVTCALSLEVLEIATAICNGKIIE